MAAVSFASLMFAGLLQMGCGLSLSRNPENWLITLIMLMIGAALITIALVGALY
jgi:hypothetical protein